MLGKDNQRKMESELMLALFIFILGFISVLFARRLATRQYYFDLQRGVLLRFGIDFRAWVFRVTGFIMMFIAIIILRPWLS